MNNTNAFEMCGLRPGHTVDGVEVTNKELDETGELIALAEYHYTSALIEKIRSLDFDGFLEELNQTQRPASATALQGDLMDDFIRMARANYAQIRQVKYEHLCINMGYPGFTVRVSRKIAFVDESQHERFRKNAFEVLGAIREEIGTVFR